MLGEHKYLTLTAGLFLTAAQVFGAPSAAPRRGRSTTPTVREIRRRTKNNRRAG